MLYAHSDTEERPMAKYLELKLINQSLFLAVSKL